MKAPRRRGAFIIMAATTKGKAFPFAAADASVPRKPMSKEVIRPSRSKCNYAFRPILSEEVTRDEMQRSISIHMVQSKRGTREFSRNERDSKSRDAQ